MTQPFVRVQLESPYRGDTDTHLAYARAAMRDCLLRMEAPMASHLLYTQPKVLDDSVATERNRGIQAGLTWGEAAEKTVVYCDAGVSSGMLEGLRHAVDRRRPIEIRCLQWDWDENGKPVYSWAEDSVNRWRYHTLPSFLCRHPWRSTLQFQLAGPENTKMVFIAEPTEWRLEDDGAVVWRRDPTDLPEPPEPHTSGFSPQLVRVMRLLLHEGFPCPCHEAPEVYNGVYPPGCSQCHNTGYLRAGSQDANKFLSSIRADGVGWPDIHELHSLSRGIPIGLNDEACWRLEHRALVTELPREAGRRTRKYRLTRKGEELRKSTASLCNTNHCPCKR